MDFEWDTEKARINERKHGVSFFEAREVFGDKLSSTVRDPDHSVEEERFLIFGQSSSGRRLVVSYTERESTSGCYSAHEQTISQLWDHMDINQQIEEYEKDIEEYIKKEYKFPIHAYKIVKEKDMEAFLDNHDDLEDNIIKDIFRRLNIEISNIDIKSILCELIRPKLLFKQGKHIEDDKYEIIADYNTNYNALDTKLIQEFIDEYNG